MDTIQDVPEVLRFNKTPFWWVRKGSNKIADNTTESDIEASIETFLQASKFWPTGKYSIEMSKNPKDRTSGYTHEFTKAATSNAGNAMLSNSNNAYGISDAAYAKLEAEIEQKLMFREMHSKFGPLLEMVLEHEKWIKATDKKLKEDEDGDGIPDFIETIKKGSEVVKNGMEVKKMFDNKSLFS